MDRCAIRFGIDIPLYGVCCRNFTKARMKQKEIIGKKPEKTQRDFILIRCFVLLSFKRTLLRMLLKISFFKNMGSYFFFWLVYYDFVINN